MPKKQFLWGLEHKTEIGSLMTSQEHSKASQVVTHCYQKYNIPFHLRLDSFNGMISSLTLAYEKQNKILYASFFGYLSISHFAKDCRECYRLRGLKRFWGLNMPKTKSREIFVWF